MELIKLKAAAINASKKAGDYLSSQKDSKKKILSEIGRDYIHISDLIAGHFAALKYDNKNNFEVFNLGTGNKTTVLEFIGEFERTNQIRLKYEIAQRRDGDVATCNADATRANKLLNWNATKNLSEMCRDSWNAALKFKGV